MSCSVEQRRLWIQPQHQQLSIQRQCQLLGLASASYYYQPQPESAENLSYLRWLDEEYTRHPFYGVRKMTFQLQQQGNTVGPKRVRRLLRMMGLMAVYPKPRLSFNPLAHRRFPYLLKGVVIVRPNQVWSPCTPEVIPRHECISFSPLPDGCEFGWLGFAGGCPNTSHTGRASLCGAYDHWAGGPGLLHRVQHES